MTDAVAGMGGNDSSFSLGEGGSVQVTGGAARLAGTNTLAGRLASEATPFSDSLSLCSVATMDECVRHFRQATACEVASALEAASLRPAEVLGLRGRGRLEPGARADLVVLDRELGVQGTFIAGEPVWTLPGSTMSREKQRFENLHNKL